MTTYPNVTPTALAGSDEVLFATPQTYCGFTVRETGGAASATLRLFDHASAASGTLLETIALTAGESASVLYGGIRAENGIYADYGGSGTIEGSVRTAG
jgi:hypothetical protein